VRAVNQSCRLLYAPQHCIKGVWGDMYWFSRVPVTPSVLKACSDHSFNSHPLFTQHMVVARTLPGGRLSLYDFVHKRRMDGQPTQERQLQSEEERDAVLQQDFGLDLSLPALS
jgi:arylamine N-acetyltransferase